MATWALGCAPPAVPPAPSGSRSSMAPAAGACGAGWADQAAPVTLGVLWSQHAAAGIPDGPSCRSFRQACAR